ncbi:hypothetical protein ACLQ24_27540, partial [Micromonospora sp. DT4]
THNPARTHTTPNSGQPTPTPTTTHTPHHEPTNQPTTENHDTHSAGESVNAFPFATWKPEL